MYKRQLYVIRDVRMILEILLGSITALTQTGIAHGEPRAGFVEDAEFHTEIDQLARAGNAFAVHNIELSLLERGSDLVFYNLYAGVALSLIHISNLPGGRAGRLCR